MQQDENYRVKEYLWTLAGFKRSIIRQCKVDEFHVTIIGVLLLLVGIYATLAWTFFFQTVTDSVFVAIAGGLFMGAFIVAFDRALIASLATGNTNIFSLGFRLMLAILLGIFLAQPMILKFYEPEIAREAEILMDQKVQERRQELETLKASETTSLREQKAALETQMDKKQALLDQAELDFKAEMDGSGGTGRYGYSVVSQQKEKILQRHQREYDALAATIPPQVAVLQARLDTIESGISAQIETYRAEHQKVGTLILAEALESLIRKDESKTLRNRILLLTLILTLIELSALIAKMLFKTASYRAMAGRMHEVEVQQSIADKEIALSKLEKYKAHTLESELALIQQFFDQSATVNEEKLEELMAEWRSDKGGRYKDYWLRFKDALTIHDR